jgi:hypothetical protein
MYRIEMNERRESKCRVVGHPLVGHEGSQQYLTVEKEAQDSECGEKDP